MYRVLKQSFLKGLKITYRYTNQKVYTFYQYSLFAKCNTYAIKFRGK